MSTRGGCRNRDAFGGHFAAPAGCRQSLPGGRAGQAFRQLNGGAIAACSAHRGKAAAFSMAGTEAAMKYVQTGHAEFTA